MARGLRPSFVAVAACLSVLPGCGEPPPPEVPTASTEMPAPTATATAKAVSIPDPVLPPLAATRPPCDAAAGLRKDADEALSKGRAYKAVRAAEKADRLCPSTAAASWKTRLDALSKLGRDDAAKALAKEIVAAPSADPAAATAARAELAKTPVPTTTAPPAPSPAKPPSAKPAKGAAAKAPAPAVTPLSAGEKQLATALAAHGSGATDAREQLDRALVKLEQETSEVPRAFFDVGPREALALSADGAMAVIGAGNTAILIDTKGQKPRRFIDHESRVVGAALSADKKQLATVAGGDVMLWSTETGKLVRKLAWAREEATQVVFMADGKTLVTAGGTPFDAPVRVWNAETGDSMESFLITGPFGATALAVSRDGKMVAVGTKLGVVELWSLSPAKKIARLADDQSFMESTTSIDFSPKGDKVVVGAGSGKIEVFETKQGKSALKIASTSHSGAAVMFSADGSRLVGSGRSSFDPVIREWDTVSGNALQNKPSPMDVNLLSRDGKVGVGAGADGVGVLDVVAGTAVTRDTRGVRLRSIHLLPPRTLVVTPSFGKGLRLVAPRGSWSLDAGDAFATPAMSLDGRTLVHASYRTASAWDVESGAPAPGYPSLSSSVDAIGLGPDGRQLRAVARDDDTLVVKAASPGDASYKDLFRVERKDVRRLFLSAYGRFGVILEDKRARLVDLADGRVKAVEGDDSERIQEAAISGDGNSLFILRDEQLTRFDSRTGKATHGPLPMGCYSSDLAASFDGSQVVAACSREVAILSFGPGGEVKAQGKMHLEDMVHDGIAIAPHGDLIATGHDGGSVRLWTRTGGLRGEIFWIGGAHAALLRTADGRVLPLGEEASKVEDRLFCRLGSRALPFAVCADALTDEGLLEEVLAPAP